MRRVFAAIALIVSATTWAVAQPAASNPLERVVRYAPDDAHLLVVIPSPDALQQGIRAFGEALAIEEAAEFSVRDLYEELLGEAQAAISTTSPIALALVPGHEEPLVIASVTSDEAWRSRADAEKLVGAFLVYECPGADHLVASDGQIAIIGREKADLKRAAEATGKAWTRFERAAVQDAKGQHVVICIHVPGWKDQIGGFFGIVQMAAAQGMAGAQAEAELPMQLVSWMLDNVKRMLDEAQDYVATVRIDARGILLRSRAGFDADARVAKYLRAIERSDRDPWRGLKSEAGEVLMAYEWKSPADANISHAMTKCILDVGAVKEKLGAETLARLERLSAEMNDKLTGANAAFTIASDGGMLYWGSYLTSDAPTVRKHLRTMFELTPELLSAWGTVPATIKPGAPVRVGDVEADAYEMKLNANEQLPEGMLEAIYGKDPLFLVASSAQGMTFVMGPRAAAQAQLEKLLSKEGTALSEDARVKKVFETLTPKPQFCALVDLPRLLERLAKVVDRMGMPFPELSLASEKPELIGLAFYMDPDTANLRAELFIPLQPIQIITKAVRDLDSGGGEEY